MTNIVSVYPPFVYRYDHLNRLYDILQINGTDLKQSFIEVIKETKSIKRNTLCERNNIICDELRNDIVSDAVRNDDDRVIAKLLDSGYGLYQEVSNSRDLMRFALFYGKPATKIVKLLIDRGYDINMCDKSGNTLLIYACIYCEIRVVRLLIEHGADVNFCGRNNKFRTPLWVSINAIGMSCKPEEKHKEISKLLIEHGAKMCIE